MKFILKNGSECVYNGDCPDGVQMHAYDESTPPVSDVTTFTEHNEIDESQVETEIIMDKVQLDKSLRETAQVKYIADGKLLTQAELDELIACYMYMPADS